MRRELERTADVPIGRALLEEASVLAHHLGPGPETRPTPPGTGGAPLDSAWLVAAYEAMGWTLESAWQARPRTLSHLVPDFVVVRSEHHVFVDAKYKPHLLDVRRRWEGVSSDVRDAHRADVHQALAYAALSAAPAVDTVLAYPVASGGPAVFSAADLPVGTRRSRLVLAGLPFGFSRPAERDRVIAQFDRLLRGW